MGNFAGTSSHNLTKIYELREIISGVNGKASKKAESEGSETMERKMKCCARQMYISCDSFAIKIIILVIIIAIIAAFSAESGTCTARYVRRDSGNERKLDDRDEGRVDDAAAVRARLQN